jgi:hypothetical protein
MNEPTNESNKIVPLTRSHFANVSSAKFLICLLHNQYEPRNDDEYYLKYKPNHIIGTPVQSFNLSNWRSIIQIIQIIAQQSISIRDLNIEGNDEVNDLFLIHLLSKTPTSIIQLNISGCINLNSSSIPLLCQLTNLKVLNISDLSFLDDLMFSKLCCELMLLEELNVAGSS